MNKLKKVVKVIFILLGVALALGFVALYIFDTETAKGIVTRVMDYINRPLPVIGGSISIFAAAVYYIFKNTIYGKNFIDKVKKHYEETELALKNNSENEKKQVVAILNAYSEELDAILCAFNELCDTIPNAKVKNIGEKINESIKAKKQNIQNMMNKIAEFDAVELITYKDNIASEIKERVEKELVEKYGKEATNNSTTKE